MSSIASLLTTDRIPPAIAFLLREVLVFEPSFDHEPSALFLERLEQAYDAGEPWLSNEPALAAFGHRLLDPRVHERTRQQGCVWLTLFPSIEMVDALSKVALDEREPLALRDQAAWSLGFRQALDRHASCSWSDEAVARADETLIRLAESATSASKVVLTQLPLALRHVDAPALFEVLAKAPALWGEAYEAFATPAFARVLLEKERSGFKGFRGKRGVWDACSHAGTTIRSGSLRATRHLRS